MIKHKYKNAFSLIEILIVLVIIAIISVMGLEIAKKGIAKAYYEYYYTGFDTLDTVLNETERSTLSDYYSSKQKKTMSETELNKSTRIKPNGLSINSPFAIAITHLFDAENTSSANPTTQNIVTSLGNSLSISHHNGIKYKITYISGTEDNKNDIYLIKMNVPKVRTKDSIESEVDLIYQPNESGALKLIPTDIGDINLADQAGILPYMLDDTKTGTMGKIVTTYIRKENGDLAMDENGNPLKTITYEHVDNIYSFKQAYCTKYQTTSINLGGKNYLTCTDSDRVANKPDYSIMRRVKHSRY